MAAAEREFPDDYMMLADTGVSSLPIFQSVNPQMADALDTYDEYESVLLRIMDAYERFLAM